MKCDALNMPHGVGTATWPKLKDLSPSHGCKGRNRDTAWFAAIDGEWPALKDAFNAWLSPTNFDTNGQQKKAFKFNASGSCTSDPMQDR